MEVKFLETQEKAKENFQYDIEKDFAVGFLCLMYIRAYV